MLYVNKVAILMCAWACQAAQEQGMGPRSSSLIFGYTTYHKLAEESLVDLLKMEVRIC